MGGIERVRDSTVLIFKTLAFQLWVLFGVKFRWLVALVVGLRCGDSVRGIKDLLRVGGGEFVSSVSEFANGLVDFVFLNILRS